MPMFEKLRNAFSNSFLNIINKEITEKDIDNNIFEFQISLLESDIAQEVIDEITKKLKKELVGLTLEKQHSIKDIIQSGIKSTISEILDKSSSGQIDLLGEIRSKHDSKAGPFIIVFLGINGTGKTTTVAKFANLLHKNGLSVVLAASDTHRAGAIEQLSEHARRLSLKIITQRYGADPSAVARDAVEYARKHRIDVVLIDTAGRMQTAKNLMDEINKIIKVVKPDKKIFVGDSLAGNDTINQAKEFFSYTDFDGAILTKIDADSKGGSVISVAYITSRPILYIGTGQGYDDIVYFDRNKFMDSLFSGSASVIENKSIPERFSKLIKTETNNVSLPAITQSNEAAEPNLINENVVITSSNNLEKLHENKDVIVSKIEHNIDFKIQNENFDIKTQTSTSNEDLSAPSQEQINVKKKGGFFSSFFGKKNKKDKDDKKENSSEHTKNQESKSKKSTNDENTTDNNDSTSEKVNLNQKENKSDVVYLSDEDIEDLFKQ